MPILSIHFWGPSLIGKLQVGGKLTSQKISARVSWVQIPALKNTFLAKCPLTFILVKISSWLLSWKGRPENLLIQNCSMAAHSDRNTITMPRTSFWPIPCLVPGRGILLGDRDIVIFVAVQPMPSRSLAQGIIKWCGRWAPKYLIYWYGRLLGDEVAAQHKPYNLH